MAENSPPNDSLFTNILKKISSAFLDILCCHLMQRETFLFVFVFDRVCCFFYINFDVPPPNINAIAELWTFRILTKICPLIYQIIIKLTRQWLDMPMRKEIQMNFSWWHPMICPDVLGLWFRTSGAGGGDSISSRKYGKDCVNNNVH